MATLVFPGKIDPFTRKASAPVTLPAAPWIILDDRLTDASDAAAIPDAHIIAATQR